MIGDNYNDKYSLMQEICSMNIFQHNVVKENNYDAEKINPTCYGDFYTWW